MKKKLALLTILSTVTVAVVAATGFFAVNSAVKVQGQEAVNNYSVDLKIDPTTIEFDEYHWRFDFEAKGEFMVGSTKYELTTEPGYTYFSSHHDSGYELDDSYFIKFPNHTGFDFGISVPVVARAQFNESKSKLVWHVEGTETYYSEYFYYYGGNEETSYYHIYIEGNYDEYGKTLIFDYARLVFSCVA